MKLHHAIPIVCAVSLLGSGRAHAASSNQTTNIQGVLRDATGNLQSMAVGLIVSFYPSQTATQPFYMQNFPTVPVDNGFFSIELSDVSASFAANADTWVGVQVAGDPTELPRQHLTAVPYAISAITANSATTADTAAAARSLTADCSGCVGDAMLASGISSAKINFAVEPDFDVANGGSSYGLQNGWLTWPDSNYGRPTYFKDPFGMVHLNGLLGNGPAGKTAFVLRPGYAPPIHRIFIVSGGCEVRVFSDGSVQPQPNCPSNAWISLDPISFRAK
jgi:hypothetical protein